jgi:hypothetical protein
MNNDPKTNMPKDTLRSFLQEEIKDLETRLGQLKGKIKDADYQSMAGDLQERRETLDAIQDDNDSQLYLLRREIGMFSENLEALSVKRRWWSGIPLTAWLALLALVIVLYFGWLYFLQWRGGNQGLIYDYPATLTATAMQAEAPSTSSTPIPTLTVTP